MRLASSDALEAACGLQEIDSADKRQPPEWLAELARKVVQILRSLMGLAPPARVGRRNTSEVSATADRPAPDNERQRVSARGGEAADSYEGA